MYEIEDTLQNEVPNIIFKNVCFSWPGNNKNVINNCSFSINKSGLWMIVGKNGSGKSTLLKLINGLLEPTSGVINNVANVGMVFQNPEKIDKKRKVSWIVGKLVYEALLPTVEKLNKIDGLTINLYGLPSVYWGQDQVVTGLLTGEDLIIGLQNKDLGESMFIPSIMLKLNSDLFLDDKNIIEVSNKLKTNIHVLEDTNDIINSLIGLSNTKKILNYA
ncbi:DUF512 domain-containing protein [Prochlorococcus sp. AH-716-O05]|nr:DUF512 domain-containing protein [Prochlorococcus sp. AH-716-O05]